MCICVANKFAKFHTKRLNRSETIPKSFFGGYFFETPGTSIKCALCCGGLRSWREFFKYSVEYSVLATLQ